MRHVFGAFLGFVRTAMSGAGVSSAADTVAASGRVYDLLFGTAIADARVTVYGPAGMAWHGVTDGHGRYHAVGIASGTITVTIERQGYESDSQRCALRAGETLQSDFGLTHWLKMIGRTVRPCLVEADPIDRYTVP
jgi:hypothetical protein